MARITLKGAKGGGGSFKNTPDNLRSNDTFEGVLGMAIGPLKGPTRGLKSIKFDGTAVENETGELNFDDFSATIGNGDPTLFPQVVNLKLGAGASPQNIGLTLANTNTGAGQSTPGPWVTRTLTNTGADFIDLRFIAQQLFRQDEKGIYNTTATIEIQMKPVGSTTWVNPTLANPTTTYTETGWQYVQPGGEGTVKLYLPQNYFNTDGTWSTTKNTPNFTINGKTTSAAVYELRLGVPNDGNYANKQWDIRARLLERASYTSGQDTETRNIVWESIAAVYSGKMGTTEAWRGVAWMQLYGKASDQLSGVPEITGEWDTKIINVPPATVFNPDTRQYTSTIWNGTWTKAYTNDPAWLLNDLITDPLSGLSLMAPGSYLNKWDALELSKWCSTLVPDGNGGTHPRYSMNYAINQPQKAEEFIRYVAGAVGALAWDTGNGEWRVKVDKPEAPVDIFSFENIEGDFVYSNTDVDTRYNDIVGQFKNAEMDYREDSVHLYDNTSIAAIGRKTTTLALVGCTNRQEALRRVMLRMRSTVNENRIVNFVTNRRGRNINQLDTILVADPELGADDQRTSGRVISITGTNRRTITLRDPVYLAPGLTYTIRFAVPNPAYAPDGTSQPTSAEWRKPTLVETRTVTTSAGASGLSTAVLTVSADMPTNVAENLQIALSAAGLPTIPKLFRVTSVTMDDDGERIAIAAIEVDTDKWSAADNVTNQATVFQDLRGKVPPPTVVPGKPLLSVTKVPIEQGHQVNLLGQWVRPSGAFISGFRVQYSVNGGALQTAVERTQFTDWELPNVSSGTYRVEVCTVDRRGGYSEPLVGTLVVDQDVLGAGDITYDGGETLEELKPAEPGATDGMNPAEKTEFDQLQADQAAADAAIAAAQAQITALQGSVSADFSDLNDAVDALNSEVDTAQSNISTLQSTTGSLGTSVSTLQGQMSTAQGNISTLQSTTGSLGTSVSTLQGQMSTAQGNISSLQTQAAGIVSDVDGLESQIVSQGGQISTLQSTVSTQGGQISTLQTTVSNAVGDVATLKTQVTAGGGNLLVNTDFGLDTSGWVFSVNGANGSVPLRNSPSSDYYPPNENTLVTQQNNTTSTGYADWTQTIEVAASKWYDVSVYAASHRCQIQIYLMWLDSAGAAVGTTPSVGPFGHAGGGNTLGSFFIRSFKAQAPAGAVRARLYLRKFGTNSGTTDSWAWFLRPQVVEVLAGTATPVAYSPGSARSTISVQATALSSLTTNVSTLSTTVSTQGGSISTLQSSVSTLQGSVSTLQTTVSTQGTNITSLQTAVSTAQGDLATLKTQVNAGGGNLLVNTDFAIDTSGWAVGLQNSAVADRVPSGDQWMVTDENGLRLYQPNGTTTGYSDWSAPVPVEAGKWYDVSVYAAAHRCQVQAYLQFYDSAGSPNLGAGASGLVSTLTGGNVLGNWTRIGFKTQAPVGAVRARFILRKFGTLAGASEANSYAWFLRPQVAETLATSSSPLAYSPGSARAVIATQAQALSTATSSLATLSTTVSTQGGSISTLQSSYTSLSGTVSSLSTTVSTQGGSISTLQSSMSTAQGNISTLQSTVSTQGGQISTLQSTQSSQGTDLATLKTQVTAGGGNLLVNTDFGLDTSGWAFGTTHSATYGRNLPSSAYYPPNENTLTIVQSNNTTTGYSDLNQIIEVTEGKWYDVSCYCASHRCQTIIYIQWLDSSGNASLGAPNPGAIGPVGGGDTLGSFSIRSVKAQAPTGAVRARFILRKLGTISGQVDSYAWFLRPQVVEVLANTATPVAYSPGSSRASIVTQANALSTLNTSFSSLSTTVSTQGGSISTLQSSMTSAQGSISTLQSTVSTQGGQISTLQSTSSTQAGQISTLQSTVSTQGGSISTMQSTLTTLQGTVSTLNTVVTASSNPNIVQNGGFENGFTGWVGGGVNANNWAVQNWVWGYWAANSGWTGATNNNFAYIDSTPFGVAGAGNYVTQSFDVDFQGGAGCVAYGAIVWLNSTGGAISTTRGPDIAPRGFDATGSSRVKITHTAPSGAQTAICRIVFVAPNGAVMSAINVRHVKVEFGSVATPYSGEATAGQMYQAYSTLNTSFASLSTTVSSQGGSISTLQSSYTSLNGTVSTLSGTVSTQGSSISTLQSASSTQAGQISTLQSQVRSGGGNLLVNTDVASDLSGWVFSSGNGSLGERVASGDQWVVTGENGLRTSQPNTTAAGQGDWTQEVAVEEGKWYDVSVYAASHRANIQVYLQFINASGTVLSTPTTGLIAPAGGGNTLASFIRRSFKDQAPTGAVKAKLYLRKFGTLSSVDSYAWWLRPQVVETSATSASPVAYSPGSARATIQTQAQALSTATSSLATLSSTVSTQGGYISTLQSSMSTAQGNISTLQSTVSAQGTSISTLQSAVSTAQGDVATLKTQITAGGSNLLVNTDAAVGIDGWSTGGTMTTGVYFGINTAGDAWRPVPENILGIQQANTTSTGYQEYTQVVPVQANRWYYASVMVASHRSTTALYVQFLDASNNVVGAGLSATNSGAGTGGNTIAAFATMSGKAQAPANAVSARFFLRKFSTTSGQTPDSYAWFLRPQLVETTADSTTPPAYGVGSARSSIQVQASALSTLNTQYASLSSTVSTQGVTITNQATAITTLQGNVSTLFAQVGVTLDVNGYVTGWKANNNGTSGSFIISADYFQILKPGGGARTEYSGGNWRVYNSSGTLKVRMGIW